MKFLVMNFAIIAFLLATQMPELAVSAVTIESQSGVVAMSGTEEPKQLRTLSGWFTVVWGDAADKSQITKAFFLTDDTGHSRRLFLGEALGQSVDLVDLNGRRVVIQGEWRTTSAPGDDTLIFNVHSIRPEIEAGARGPADAIAGTQPWVSILCKFADETAEPKPLSFFQEMYAGTYPGLDNYWRELSYDTINLAGSVAVGWYTLRQPTSYYVYDVDGDGDDDLDFGRLAEDCTAAADADVYFPDFAGINLMMNSTPFFFYYGGSWRLTIDGVTQVWRMTWIWSGVYGNNLALIEHEMGHGFGLPHSGTYGGNDNFWDVMGFGTGWPGIDDPVFGRLGIHTIAHHKDILGWIPADKKLEVGAGGSATVRLERLANPMTDNYRLIKIPIAGSASRFYTLEARKWEGHDAGVPGEAVIIHEVDTNRSPPAHLLDFDGDILTFDDQMWTVGETFVDSTYNIEVSVDAATETGFVISIIVGESPPGFTTCDAQPQIPLIECEALVAFYSSTEGDNWARNTGWMEYLGPCDWYRVTCVEGHVTDLILSYNNLSGSIPEALGVLAELEVLYLTNNQLVGNIPAELGNLSNLQTLRLGSNQLSGIIPPELSGLTALWRLDLSDNQLSGPIPSQLGNLSNLQRLDLYANRLSGIIPPELSNLGKLQGLLLDANRLTGGIPPELGNLTGLEWLVLSDNRLTGGISAELGNLARLYVLKVENNALDGEIPSALTNLVNLGSYEWAELDLGYNMLSASDPLLRAFLNEKDADWEQTQTVPPTNVNAAVVSGNSIQLTWTPIIYTWDDGYYEISSGTSPEGPFTVHGTTSDKTNTGYVADNLLTGTNYHFAVRTCTPAHGRQQNDLLTASSLTVSAATPEDPPPPIAADYQLYLPLIFQLAIDDSATCSQLP